MSANMVDHGADDALRRALHDAAPAPPADEVDWAALQARITAAAQPLLQPGAAAWPGGAGTDRATRPPSVWQPLAGWSPFGIPLAAAAAVVLMIGTAALGTRQVGGAEDAGVAFLTIEEALLAGLSSGARPLVADVGTDAMIDLALFHDGEDW
jgi:hypothetical protein